MQPATDEMYLNPMLLHRSPLGGSVKELQNLSQLSKEFESWNKLHKTNVMLLLYVRQCSSLRSSQAALGGSVSTRGEVTETRTRCNSGRKSCMCTVGAYTYITLSNTEIYVTHMHSSSIPGLECLVLGGLVLKIK